MYQKSLKTGILQDKTTRDGVLIPAQVNKQKTI